MCCRCAGRSISSALVMFHRQLAVAPPSFAPLRPSLTTATALPKTEARRCASMVSLAALFRLSRPYATAFAEGAVVAPHCLRGQLAAPPAASPDCRSVPVVSQIFLLPVGMNCCATPRPGALRSSLAQ